ncbi:ATP-dependent zinc metalloprotease FtsH 1 [Clostridium pasteurianum DSM 525 = ATCC 6013]|uniref:ATP-dependent zinc metalloprotease FtsH n=1 Tax=Clostridium pasteurianum DSM 525 = ATCC 6013 TaxID=1262449 RepID=A0A0H3J7V6_CLOPA|nr:ATP-dependent metallopeptidase FtsH/Yme1/Tma family protein [Clostridium pasteurianum]AJA49282.1 ATP-dependent zinc metalloprotease FtsH 1 [Clostridium pasteurianum DSM 525 = ATCC 6013]AJA53270.1 ATP-dependent zinc metalloprotease FtsH 1 [Clostridium pasteurianum DSM 525 = ATCC 6013]AOZ76460.1 cell division protein FtsH [Clostridium pasteurianum DSM 525 = ATCC 6013]AOZ80257.1 cell division protein FtsH [Clostridium pasteurianum]ELP58302.1 ATP-dependent Zn protease [Clostridium pasteurianum 
MYKLKNKYLLIPLITAAISLVLLIIFNLSSGSIKDKLYLDFEKDLASHKVSQVSLTNSPNIDVKLKDGTIYKTDNPRTDTFKADLLGKGVKVSEKSLSYNRDVAPVSVLSLSIVTIIVMLIKSSNVASKSLFSVDALSTDAVEDIGFNFKNVAGNEEAKESVKDVVDFLKNPEKYNSYGARMPKGIILYGEPGTGKTLLAKAVAGEAGVPFYAMSGSDFIQVYVGVGASRVRQLFKKARAHGKAVIFIDEIDAIGKKRDSSKAGGSDERDQTLNALLTEMSGFNEKEGIIVMAATNRLDMLDSALLRPGRFDRHIEIVLPDLNARKEILSLHLKNKPVAGVNIDDLARKTSYFSGAKLENLVNEAAILACKSNSKFIENIHFDKAYSIVIAGYEKINRSNISDKDKSITAFHESGHALVSLKTLPGEKVSKVTIIPSTKGAGGYTLSIPEDKLYQNKDYIMKRIMVLLAGRAAEDIIFGKDFITTGAYNDFKESTRLVTNMVTQYGMGETLGLLNLSELSNINYNPGNDIVNECKNIINSLYNETKNVLLLNKDILDKLASELLDKETLNEADLLNIVK